MKKIIKLIPIFCLLFVLSCENDDDNTRFSNDPTIGWVEFSTPTEGTTISIITDELIVPVSVRVPIFEDGITVSYTIEPVQGDFNTILTTGSNITLPAVQSSADGSAFVGNISLGFDGVSDLDEIIIFDVVITGTDIDGVEVGLNEDSITRYRISTPCPIDTTTFEGTYTVDEMFTGPPNGPNGLSDFFNESYQIELTVDSDDVTETRMIVNNSIGFNTYVPDGTILIFDTCNFTVSFIEEPLELAGFSTLVIESSSYVENENDDSKVITANGAFGTFGNYEFVWTKQ